MICKLALEDGWVFTGNAVGASGTRAGEVVFNTSLTGYQEICTDPSYCGQIVTMTFPLIGNYGVNPEDFESTHPFLSGFVVKELSARPSNHRATGDLGEFLKERGIIALAGIDTRALTRRIRMQGALRGVLSTEIEDDRQLVRLAQAAPSMTGANLVDRVTSRDIQSWDTPLYGRRQDATSVTCEGPHGSAEGRVEEPTKALPSSLRASVPSSLHIVALDCGIKHNVLRHLAELGCRVTVAPGGFGAAAIQDLEPDGILVSNGPGDPAALSELIETLRALIGSVPMIGICLGHQLLASALGAKTYKLKFGHHGGNVPVMNHPTGRVEITCQNHGFAVDADSLTKTGARITHTNLNDGSLEGFTHEDKRLVAVQFHPEASPGPHDASYLFTQFVADARARRSLP